MYPGKTRTRIAKWFEEHGHDGWRAAFLAKRSGCNTSSEHTFCFAHAIHHRRFLRKWQTTSRAPRAVVLSGGSNPYSGREIAPLVVAGAKFAFCLHIIATRQMGAEGIRGISHTLTHIHANGSSLPTPDYRRKNWMENGFGRRPRGARALEENQLTSWGATSNDTVRRSTLQYVSTQGSTKKIPGPRAPPVRSRPSRKMTALSYSCTTCKIKITVRITRRILNWTWA